MRYSLENIIHKQIGDIAPCVYSIYFRTTLLYIGQTKKSLFRRIYSHISEKTEIGTRIYDSTKIICCDYRELRYVIPQVELLKVWWIEVIDVSGFDIDACEQSAILKYRPLLNKRSVRLQSRKVSPS